MKKSFLILLIMVLLANTCLINLSYASDHYRVIYSVNDLSQVSNVDQFILDGKTYQVYILKEPVIYNGKAYSKGKIIYIDSSGRTVQHPLLLGKLNQIYIVNYTNVIDTTKTYIDVINTANEIMKKYRIWDAILKYSGQIGAIYVGAKSTGSASIESATDDAIKAVAKSLLEETVIENVKNRLKEFAKLETWLLASVKQNLDTARKEYEGALAIYNSGVNTKEYTVVKGILEHIDKGNSLYLPSIDLLYTMKISKIIEEGSNILTPFKKVYGSFIETLTGLSGKVIEERLEKQKIYLTDEDKKRLDELEDILDKLEKKKNKTENLKDLVEIAENYLLNMDIKKKYYKEIQNFKYRYLTDTYTGLNSGYIYGLEKEIRVSQWDACYYQSMIYIPKHNRLIIAGKDGSLYCRYWGGTRIYDENLNLVARLSYEAEPVMIWDGNDRVYLLNPYKLNAVGRTNNGLRSQNLFYIDLKTNRKVLLDKQADLLPRHGKFTACYKDEKLWIIGGKDYYLKGSRPFTEMVTYDLKTGEKWKGNIPDKIKIIHHLFVYNDKIYGYGTYYKTPKQLAWFIGEYDEERDSWTINEIMPKKAQSDSGISRLPEMFSVTVDGNDLILIPIPIARDTLPDTILKIFKINLKTYTYETMPIYINTNGYSMPLVSYDPQNKKVYIFSGRQKTRSCFNKGYRYSTSLRKYDYKELIKIK